MKLLWLTVAVALVYYGEKVSARDRPTRKVASRPEQWAPYQSARALPSLSQRLPQEPLPTLPLQLARLDHQEGADGDAKGEATASLSSHLAQTLQFGGGDINLGDRQQLEELVKSGLSMLILASFREKNGGCADLASRAQSLLGLLQTDLASEPQKEGPKQKESVVIKDALTMLCIVTFEVNSVSAGIAVLDILRKNPEIQNAEVNTIKHISYKPLTDTNDAPTEMRSVLESDRGGASGAEMSQSALLRNGLENEALGSLIEVLEGSGLFHRDHEEREEHERKHERSSEHERHHEHKEKREKHHHHHHHDDEIEEEESDSRDSEHHSKHEHHSERSHFDHHDHHFFEAVAQAI